MAGTAASIDANVNANVVRKTDFVFIHFLPLIVFISEQPSLDIKKTDN
jgi:hypothetical protein